MYLALVVLGLVGVGVRSSPRPADTGLRMLLQNPHNQELIDHLGTRYEIVNPVQVRQDWERGLSTRLSSINGSITHIQQTALWIETFEYKLHLDLELNKNLFPSTLVQFVYEKEGPPTALPELPENCFYHATVRNYPEASAAFCTCDGMRGIILLEDKVFLLHPLKGNQSENHHPHLLYHFSSDQLLNCDVDGDNDPVEDLLNSMPEEGVLQRNKYIEIAAVIDQTLFEKFESPPKEIIAATVEMINYVDLLWRPLNTSISLVFIEIWIEDQMRMDEDISKSLQSFQEYSKRKIKRISIDSAYLLSGQHFKSTKKGIAKLDTICTVNAVGLANVDDIFQPHLTANILTHLIGHNLGMKHDSNECNCTIGCIMKNNVPYFSSTEFSNCSIASYFKTLHQGYGACLFNMPTMRMSICGNSILEESEECDCGPPEECIKYNPCCDPMTCKLIKHAECSSGACCKKCKLLSSDHLCRPSKGECDIPEFCEGEGGQCPHDLYKKNGAICSGGNGYCFQGLCPLLKSQCQNIWGEDADNANMACFERLNVQGTPNGNCGYDSRGEIQKCFAEDSYCGSLHCSQGEKEPISSSIRPFKFVVNKMNVNGAIHECKAREISPHDSGHTLVSDGTKCGYQKLCLNKTCIHIRSITSGKCPLEEADMTCSGHGVCTNINTCSCEEGWKGLDCSEIDEDSLRGHSDYYDPNENSLLEKNQYGENELKLNPNLAITVLAASIVIGIGLVVIAILFIFYKNMWTGKNSSRGR